MVVQKLQQMGEQQKERRNADYNDADAEMNSFDAKAKLTEEELESKEKERRTNEEAEEELRRKKHSAAFGT
jgi:hypothetical protein